MLSQEEADTLINMLKEIEDTSSPLSFPQPGQGRKLDLKSSDGKHSFVVDINRKGYINFTKKCTYQSRYQKDTVLLRLDVAGPKHTNPDGEILPETHFHIYREGYGDKYAFAVPPEIINADDLVQTLIDFLSYFKTTNVNDLDIETVM